MSRAVIAQMMSQFGDAVRHRLIGDDDVAPHLLVQRFPRNDVAGARGQAYQHVHDPGLETHLDFAPHDTVLAGLDEAVTDAESGLQLLTRECHAGRCYLRPGERLSFGGRCAFQFCGTIPPLMALSPVAKTESTTPPRSPGPGGGGFAAAIAAFGIWGLFPLYLIGLLTVSAMQITAHRIVWSCVFVLAWLAIRRELGQLWAAVMRDGVLIRLTASAFFIAVNWVGFAWAVNHGHVLEVSLAYFIGPLLNVLLGIFVLSETAG